MVVDEMRLVVREHECPSLGYGRDHVAEAVLVGTCLARFGRTERPAGPGPLTADR